MKLGRYVEMTIDNSHDVSSHLYFLRNGNSTFGLVSLPEDSYLCWAEQFLVLLGQAIPRATSAVLGAEFGRIDGNHPCRMKYRSSVVIQ